MPDADRTISVEGPDGRLIILMEVGVWNKRMDLRSVAFGDERHHSPEGRHLSESEMRWLVEAAINTTSVASAATPEVTT